MSEPTDWHRSVTYVTGDDLRDGPDLFSQASVAARHQRRVRNRAMRNRRATRQMRRR